MENKKRNIDILVKDLILESHKNEVFKKQLIKKPKEVISKFTNGQIKFKNNKSIIVEDQSDANTIYLNIPRMININDIELTEDELEMVSGGSTIGCGIVAGVAVYFITDAIEGYYNTIKSRLK